LRYILRVSDVFYLRPITPPATPEAVVRLAGEAGGCFDLHKVTWTCSFLAIDGGRMLCWYRAPDAESARLALRELGSDMNAVWQGMVLGDVLPHEESITQFNTLAEIAFYEPLPRERNMLQHLAQDSLRDTPLAAGFLSSDRRRMIGLMQAADPCAANAALAAAALPVEAVWLCTVIAPPRAAPAG
jgi:hypothetical protein